MQENCIGSSASSRPDFRNDINGLRAWAVLAVIFYHFNVPGFSGGFVGVDVFFVISGYLMTSIIISGLENGVFSLCVFYMARARRIIPALLLLCICLLFVGWFLLPSADYEALGQYVASALAFVSNITFWREAGYFDVSSHEKLLLHTWSLSVEWQFYIFLPLICMALRCWLGRRTIKIIFILGFILSFILSVYISSRWSNAAFYLLPCRAWEMLAGGLVWLILREHSLSECLSICIEKVGISIILLSFFLFNSTMQWPGYLALVPVLGAMLVLAAKRSTSYLTANLLAREIGAWSYSIYLWHWPLVVYLSYIGEQNNPSWIVFGIFTSVLLGAFSYHLVECKTRQKLLAFSNQRECYLLFCPMLITIVVGCVIFLNDGVNNDFRFGASSAKSRYIDAYSRENYLTPYLREQYKTECDFFDDSVQRAKGTGISESCTKYTNGKGVFLWGDSHAQALSFGIRSHIEKGRDFYQVATSACKPHIGYDGESLGEFRTACEKSNQAALAAIARLKPDIVILVQKNNHDKNNYEKIIEHLTNLGVRSVIIGPVPQWEPSLPRAIAWRHFDVSDKIFKDNAFDRNLFITDDYMKRKFSTISNVTYISILDFLCADGKCLSKVDDNNTPLVWDYGHLSLSGSEFIVGEYLAKREPLSRYLRE